jgi:hypothetical protein
VELVKRRDGRWRGEAPHSTRRLKVIRLERRRDEAFDDRVEI